MSRWQRRARLIIAVFAVVFAAVVFRQLKPRTTPVAPAAPPRVDPGAVVESTGGLVERIKQSQENFRLTYERQLSYANGTARMFGVTVIADRKSGGGTFTANGREAVAGPDGTTFELTGNVRLASDDIHASTDRATYAKSDNTVRAPGPVELTEGSTSAKGVGMLYDGNRDVLTILEQASVHMTPSTDITSGTATFDRRGHVRRFDRHARLQRGGQVIEAESIVAHLTEDENQIASVELHGGARISSSHPTPGALQLLTGADVNLEYAPGGEVLQHLVVSGDGSIQFAGEAGKPGRSITGRTIDVTLAADGSTPTALSARDGVLLTIPADGDLPTRTILAAALDAKGEGGKGLTRAHFSGTVQYRERGGPRDSAANSGVLDVTMKPGMGAIEEARFAQAVKFVQGAMTANAAAARYGVEQGTLALSGSEPGIPVPRVVNDQIAVDASTIDVVLDGPKVKAASGGTARVKSVLQPEQSPGNGEANGGRKMPSMLKQDQPVNVTAASLDYDGTASMAKYTGGAQLWQGDTSIKGDTITVDDKTGDLTASGTVTTMTMLEQTNKDTKTKERVRSAAQAKDLKYEDAIRRLTYTGDAHMTGPEGDMTATKIELYLKPSGDELERAEAYDNVTLREQNRKTTGARMTYTTADERYVVVGAPVTIIDQCDRETTGKTLTFVKSTDSIVVDGNQQTRTQTKGGGKCAS